MMKTLGQCSEPSPDLRVPLLQCRDKQLHRPCAESTLEMFLPRSQWTPVSHFQEPPGAERDEEPVPKSQQESCKLKPLFLHKSQQCCFVHDNSKANMRIGELTADGDGCCFIKVCSSTLSFLLLLSACGNSRCCCN